MTAPIIEPEHLRALLLNDTPFLDVRAEVEFAKGTLPTASNFPILNTDERQQVGLCYKQQGQDKAVVLGHQLVSGPVKQQRIEQWCQFASDNPNAALYCWRGGMRSNLTQQWMQQAGVNIPLIRGGYKALRRELINEIHATARSPMFIIGGKTGSAKTLLINSLTSGIDLEGFAHHRGSSFGRLIEEPPCQVDFENALAIELLKKRHSLPGAALFFEDESRMIGPVSLPLALWQAMCEAPIVVVEVPLEVRIQRVLKDYVVDRLGAYLTEDSYRGAERYRQYLLSGLHRIRKRLGSQRYQKLAGIMSMAVDQQLLNHDVSKHEVWIEDLLVNYYDPMYKYQLAKKRHRVIYSGTYTEVLQWARQQRPQ